MPLITLEEHYVSRALAPHIAPMAKAGTDKASLSPDLCQKLAKIFSVRLQQMDAAGIDIQVVSHTPIPTPKPISASACIAANDGLKDALRSCPERFATFVCLPMVDPLMAAHKLRRCIKELGFVGALIENH